MSSRRVRYYHRPSPKTPSRMAYNRFTGARWYLSTSQIFEHPPWSRSAELMNYFDSKGFDGYTDRRPVKQRRATLGSDPLRDNRTRLRRIFRPGKPTSFPTSCLSEYPELPLMPQKPRGSGGRAPNFIRLFQERKIPFHVEPRHSYGPQCLEERKTNAGHFSSGDTRNGEKCMRSTGERFPFSLAFDTFGLWGITQIYLAT